MPNITFSVPTEKSAALVAALEATYGRNPGEPDMQLVKRHTAAWWRDLVRAQRTRQAREDAEVGVPVEAASDYGG